MLNDGYIFINKAAYSFNMYIGYCTDNNRTINFFYNKAKHNVIFNDKLLNIFTVLSSQKIATGICAFPNHRLIS